MEKSRTENTIKNVKTGFLVQLINKVLAFVVRTVFIKCLNNDYLGVNGLFTNILTILSFAELGIGTAIIFNMYKPVADKNKEKIKSYMNLYKKSYNLIGIIVFILGLFVIPFMNYVVKDVPNIKENIILIYTLFLINTSSSYFFTYKKSIIIAHQQQSIINNIDSIFYILKSIFEILFLMLTKNFIVYLIIQIITTILENIYISNKANKLYPYLKEKEVEPLSKKESENIFKNVKSLVIYRLGGVIMNGTDNILISTLINVSTVGLVSNYNLITTSVKFIVSSALNGVTASVGNLNATGSIEKKEKIYYELTFVHYMIYSLCTIELIILLNVFIELWLGKNYILNISISIALAVSFFIEGMRQPAYIYRTTLGLFSKAQATPYIGAITNILLSIIFCKLWGLVGIFIATSIAQLASYSWIDTYLIYKYEFKKSSKKYNIKYISYFITFVIELLLTLLICNFVHINILLDLIIKGIITLILSITINIIIYKNTSEYKTINSRIVKPLLNKISILKK